MPEIVGNPNEYLQLIEKERERESSKYETYITKRITIHNDTDKHNSINFLFGNQTQFRVNIIEVIECGHFVAQITDDKYTEQIALIQSKLNDELSVPLKKIDAQDITAGRLVCAPFLDTIDEVSFNLYRAKVLRKLPNSVEVNYNGVVVLCFTIQLFMVNSNSK